MNKTVERLNKIYSQVKIGGRYRFYDGEDFLTLQDFILGEKGYGQMIGEIGKEKFVADTTIWLNSKDRNLYRKCVSYPGKVSPDTFNLWSGWGVKPKYKKNGYHLFMTHLKKNLCNGNLKHLNWLWQWMAQWTQEPWTKPGSAVVLIGGKGCGKSIFGNILDKLAGKGNHYTIAKGATLTGRFNGMFESALLCTVDEATFGGDRQNAGVVKNIITAPEIAIERKGLEIYQAPNYTRFLFTSNDGWVINTSLDERRYFCLNVQDYWTEDNKVWGDMIVQLENGGYEALLYDLQKTQLRPDTYILRKPPVTDALKQQQRNSESPLVRAFREWWEDKVIEINDLGFEWQGDVWSRDFKSIMEPHFLRLGKYRPEWKTFLRELREVGFKYERKQGTHLGRGREYHFTFDVKSGS